MTLPRAMTVPRTPRPVLPAGYRLVSRETVGSTNDEARNLARDGAAEGTVVWALAQTAGRGRRGRHWSSPRGNLYASLILRPACSADRAAQLGFVAALTVMDALSELVPGIDGVAGKWPNDVLVKGRKIAGILLESEMSEGGNLAYLVVGAGVNLVSAPPDAEFRATSVAGEGYPPPPPGAALEALARHFDAWAKRWRAQGFGPVRDAWRARSIGFGEQIQVRLDTATLRGKFVDLDHQGRLLLETDGGLQLISAGDVFPAR
jgi:BirA family transcriptional regulator, biotin operon repressor / biotin---[acetyl-CoA-carboxylase] ligase